MANSIVGGLFGIDPTQLVQEQQAQQEKFALTQAAMDPMQAAQYNMIRTGQQLGNVASGLMGIQDPQLKAVGLAQQLAGQFDTSTSAGLKDFADALRQAGIDQNNPQLANFAMMALDKSRSLDAANVSQMYKMAQTKKELALADKALRDLPGGIDALVSKSTPASVAKFMKSGNVADLVRASSGKGGSAKISFGEERYDLDKQGAINFLAQYNLKPTDKIPPNLAVTMPQLIQAQQIALRPNTPRKGGGKEVVLTMPGGEED